MIWLEKGVLKTGDKKSKKKYINQYEEIPSGFISSERMKQLEELGMVGSEFPGDVKKAKIKEQAQKKADKE